MLGGSDNPYQRRRTFITVVTILFVITIFMMLIARSESDAFAKPRAFIDGIVSPVSRVLTMPIRGAEALSQRTSNRRRAFEENERLKRENARLREVEWRANALTLKLNRYEEILKTDIEDDIPVEKIPARAVSETQGPFVRSALLNVGRTDGVMRGHAVMTTQGLYGHIIRVGTSSSRALRLTDLNSRIAVMSERSGDRAIITGTNAAAPSLSFIDPEADWKPGDRVLTSGDEGVLPQGLPIGLVAADPERERLSVSLFTTGKVVDWVWVYPFEPIQTPEANMDEGTLGSDKPLGPDMQDDGG